MKWRRSFEEIDGVKFSLTLSSLIDLRQIDKPLKMITLSQLQNTIAQIAQEVKADFPSLFFDYAGLMPTEKDFKYDSSPLNTITFAGTGGDGVHYGILLLSETIQPVVMTIPMNSGNDIGVYNWILAENLDEFLGLGYYNGWFFLEQIAYQSTRERAFAHYSGDHFLAYEDFSEVHFITRLRTALGYAHSPLSVERLKELKEKYFHFLAFKPDFLKMISHHV